KLITCNGQGQIIITPYKILFIHGHGPTTVVIVKLDMVGKKAIITLDLLAEVLDLVVVGAPGSFAIAIEYCIIINHFAVDLEFYVLEEINIIFLAANLHADNCRS